MSCFMGFQWLKCVNFSSLSEKVNRFTSSTVYLFVFSLFKMNGKLNYTVCESTLKMQPNDALVANEFTTIRPFPSVEKL